jgi:hypothetical protein
MNKHYEKWDQLAPQGLLLIGLGVSIIGSAIVTKSRRKSFLWWFLKGMVGLITLNAGVSFFGEAIKHRTLYELDVKELTKSGES